jgi:hypothetical protein
VENQNNPNQEVNTDFILRASTAEVVDLIERGQTNIQQSQEFVQLVEQELKEAKEVVYRHKQENKLLRSLVKALLNEPNPIKHEAIKKNFNAQYQKLSAKNTQSEKETSRNIVSQQINQVTEMITNMMKKVEPNAQ